MFDGLKSKLKSESGESLPEVLVATLIMALGMTLFAGMTTSSFRIIKRAETTFKAYADGKNSLEEADLASEEQNGNMTLTYGPNANMYVNAIPGQKLNLPIAYAEAEGDGFRLVRYEFSKEDGS